MRYRWNEARLAPLNREEPPAPEPIVEEEEAQVQRPALGALLIDAGLVTAEQIRDALAEGLNTGERLGEVVVRRGWASEERVAQLLAVQWQLRFRKAETISIDPMAIRRLSQADARRLRAVPVWFDDGGLVLAIEEPTSELFAAVKEVIGEVSYVVVARSTLDHLLSSRFLTDEPTAPIAAEESRAPALDEEQSDPEMQSDEEGDGVPEDSALLPDPEGAQLEEEPPDEQDLTATGAWSDESELESHNPVSYEEVETEVDGVEMGAEGVSEVSDVPEPQANDQEYPQASDRQEPQAGDGDELQASDQKELHAGDQHDQAGDQEDRAGDQEDRAGDQEERAGDEEDRAGDQEEPQASDGEESQASDQEGPQAYDDEDAAGSEPEGDGLDGGSQPEAKNLVHADGPQDRGADDWGNDDVTSISTEPSTETAREAEADVESVIDSIEEASSGLRSIQRQVSSLAESLRNAQDQLAERDARIESVEDAQRRDGETIRRLESELGRRDDLLEALKIKVGELNQTFENAPV